MTQETTTPAKSESADGNGLASVADLFSPGGPDRRYREVTLPVRRVRVRLQSLTERESSEYQATILNTRGGSTAYVRQRLIDANRRLIVLCMVDGAGNRMLNKNDVERMADWDAADSAFLYDECASHCGLNRDDLEGLVKNSGATTVDA